jgi:hypothetical protein
MNTSEPEASPEKPAKPRWECPALTPLGNLRELVRGLGKLTAPENDSDATNMRKSSGLG